MTASATRLREHLLFAAVLLLLAQLAAVSAQAQTRITSCATTITRPGNYILVDDLRCPAGGIRIEVGDVYLDLNQHRISSTSNPRADNGITVAGATGTVDVRGPGEIDGFRTGVEIASSPGPVSVVNVTANVNDYGFNAVGSRVGFYQCQASDGQYGFTLRVNESEIAENGADRNAYEGFLIAGAHNYIRSNRAERSQHGISTQRDSGVDNLIFGNTALHNGVDLYEGNPTCVNDWHDNIYDRDNNGCVH